MLFKEITQYNKAKKYVKSFHSILCKQKQLIIAHKTRNPDQF